jgi:hypothetical protein
MTQCLQGLRMRQFLLELQIGEVNYIASFVKGDLGTLLSWMRSIPDGGEVPNTLYHGLRRVNYMLEVLEAERGYLERRLDYVMDLIELCGGE